MDSAAMEGEAIASRVVKRLREEIANSRVSIRGLESRLGWGRDRLARMLRQEVETTIPALYEVLKSIGVDPAAFWSAIHPRPGSGPPQGVSSPGGYVVHLPMPPAQAITEEFKVFRDELLAKLDARLEPLEQAERDRRAKKRDEKPPAGRKGQAHG